MDEETIKKIRKILEKNDYQAQELKMFINNIAFGQNKDIDIHTLEFYLRIKDNPDIIKTLRNSLTIEEIKYLIGLADNIDIKEEFLSYFDLKNNYKNYSNIFYQEITKNFSLNQNILEIGCGWFPSIAKYIDLKQQNIKGTITCYDTNLKISKSGNINLIKSNINENEDISKYDFIYSSNICEALETTLKLANKYKKEFIIELCGCHREIPFDFKDVINNNQLYEFLDMLKPIEQINLELFLKGILDDQNSKMPNIIYSLYLLNKLQMLNKEQVEYKLEISKDHKPIITKKYYKKYY